jgi:hypothetical protein
MQRLIEQPADDGDVLKGAVRIGRVHYHLSVYQHFSEGEQAVPGDLVVEGRITPIDDMDLTEFHRRGSELTLRLADGRALDFSVGNDDGTIRSTGRGLHMES